MGSREFAVFILTHGRPHKVTTLNTLQRRGYTGPVYLIVDNEDSALEEYKRLYGEMVIAFDKEAIARTFDEADNFKDRRAVVYARNACFNIAQELGLEYFLQLDDDYRDFTHRFNSSLEYIYEPVMDLDSLFAAILDFYKSVPALTMAIAQNGDFMGGSESNVATRLWLKRKAMNTFFCSTSRPFAFVGRVNEDVNTYVTLGNRGELIFQINNVSVQQTPTQQSEGGMTGLYENQGTYIKSFYSVMLAPSCVKVADMGYTNRRLHHKVKWSNAVPAILGEHYRKARAAQPHIVT